MGKDQRKLRDMHKDVRGKNALNKRNSKCKGPVTGEYTAQPSGKLLRNVWSKERGRVETDEVREKGSQIVLPQWGPGFWLLRYAGESNQARRVAGPDNSREEAGRVLEFWNLSPFLGSGWHWSSCGD